MRAGLQGRYRTQAIEYQSVHGETATLDILRKIVKVIDHRRANGLRPPSGITLWNDATERHVAAKDARAKAEAEKAEREAGERAYMESKASGYQPTKPRIREQLDDLIDKGDISQEQYDVAIRSGLACVHEMTSIKEPEEFDINF